MREKLNENPMLQMVIVGVLIVAVGFLFVTRMRSASDSGSSEPASSAADATPGAAASDNSAAGAIAQDPSAIAGAVGQPGAVPDAGVASGASGAFSAGPGLPKPVAKAYASGDAIALLVTKQKGIDDKKMRKAVSSIRGKQDVKLFTVRVHNIAKYSRIGEGVDLSRVPALVVIQPKRLSGKGQAPDATVSYGYRDPTSVAQAVEDQLYHGKTLGYSPG